MQPRTRPHPAGRGFTLIELLVVIAIIALVSSVVLAALSSARAKARDARRISDIHQIYTAMMLYADANNGMLPATTTNFNNCDTTRDCCPSSNPACWNDVASSLAPYLPKLPVDPGTNAWPMVYYYMPNGYSLCTTTVGVKPPVLIVSTEINVYPLPLYAVLGESGAGGTAKARYCYYLQ